MRAKRKPIPIYFGENERAKLVEISRTWGVSISSAVQRIVREYEQVEKLEAGKSINYSEIECSVALDCFKKIRFDDFDLLPESKGVYIVTDHEDQVLYVGKAGGKRGLYGRWQGRWGHHRDEEFCANGAAWTRYLELDADCLNKTEAELIEKLFPPLNRQAGISEHTPPDMSYLQKPEWQVPDEFYYPDSW